MRNNTLPDGAFPPLYAAVLETRNYIVGAANAASGLYRRTADGWMHLGWQNLRCTALAVSGSDPGTLFLASGNGVLRSRDGGASWRVTTDWQVAEVLGLALDPSVPGSVYAASAYGVWHSPDEGETWRALPAPAPRPDATFTPALVLDQSTPARLLIGTADGLFVSEDGGRGWHPTGPRVAVRALAQSRDRPAAWLAGTDGHGVLASDDGGATWRAGAARAIVYTVCIDPADPQRMAAAGFGTDLLVSTDGGVSWKAQPLGIPARALHALAFDPSVRGRLWLGTVGDGVFYTDDGGRTCARAGLPETTVYDLSFGAAS